MARPWSVDLRERVLRAHEAGEGSQRVLAKRFGVSVGAVCGWLAVARPTRGGANRAYAAPGGTRWAGPTRRCSQPWSPNVMTST